MKIDKPVRAIICFGPETLATGTRAGAYYQVIIDPNMVSPSGRYIRFDQTFQISEIHGWQQVESLWVCEVLGDAAAGSDYDVGKASGYSVEEGAFVEMNAVAQDEVT